MKKFNVYLTAKNKINLVREVNIPDEVKPNLNEIFHYGQNEVQPQQMPSVSVGDIIEFENEFYLVNDFGFIKQGEEKEIDIFLEFIFEKSNPMLLEKFGYLYDKPEYKHLHSDDYGNDTWLCLKCNDTCITFQHITKARCKCDRENCE